MPFEVDHQDVKIISVVEFVEEIGALFDLGTQQADKLTLAKSFSKKQDRYALLLDSADSGTLIDALAGISNYRDAEASDDARKVLRAFVAHAQQLVSWIRASLVHRVIDQEELNTAIVELFGTPQLAMLMSAMFESELLEEYSPLKQLPVCVEELVRQNYDPIRACKELMRSRIQERLAGRAPVGLGFFKHLNSLDPRSSTRPATQRRELKGLSEELCAILQDEDARILIDELTGIYSAMMALKQLHHGMYRTHPQYFPAVIRQLHKDLQSATQRVVPRRLAANRDLFMFLMHQNSPRRLTARPSNTEAFRSLLENHRTFSSSGLPNLLRDFLRDGLTESWNRTKLLKVRDQLQRCAGKPFYGGVHAFVLGVLAVSEQDPGAQTQFAQCLHAAEHWPLGPFGSQAALFALGLKLALEPSPSPNGLNPLLSAYLDSLPQCMTIRLSDSRSESTETYNLHELISQYNVYCWMLIGEASPLLVNPFGKIEAYLRKLFDELLLRGWPLTAEHLTLVSRDLTTKRDVERVKSDIYGTGLHQWLSKNYLEETSRSFRHSCILEAVPAIKRYLALPEPTRTAIACASDPTSASTGS
jgi:hypothetical protein